RQFIAELSKWENSLNEEIIGKARSEILHAFNGQSPKVLYCFAGGGAIKYNAVALIFVHNHPSGSSEPSQSDKEITKDLIEASNTMQIKVLDHIIIGDNRYFSFADEGLIPARPQAGRNIT
ncbi:MAG: hypothetical protein JRI71_11755, partial [Deltaproteobacteria bacterium]|nr:hypothetical protein [Deltaproteobacteria bacterium]